MGRNFIPILDDHYTEKMSYYEFSKNTRNVYLIGCTIGSEVKGIISIDTCAEKKWSEFIIQQLILIGNIVAIAIKNHEQNESAQ
jgi:GAF domain-containing protein